MKKLRCIFFTVAAMLFLLGANAYAASNTYKAGIIDDYLFPANDISTYAKECLNDVFSYSNVQKNLTFSEHTINEGIRAMDDGALDFVAMLPGLQKSNVRSRIIMTPQNTKRLLAALADNVRKFEETHGVIGESTATRLPIGDGGLA